MLLDLLANHAQTAKVAYIYDDGKQRLEYTYRQLAEESDRIASFLLAQGEARIPVIVYGHKHPRMLAAFLGCVKAGRAYCPLDISMPEDRIQKIIDIVNPDVRDIVVSSRNKFFGRSSERFGPVLHYLYLGQHRRAQRCHDHLRQFESVLRVDCYDRSSPRRYGHHQSSAVFI